MLLQFHSTFIVKFRKIHCTILLLLFNHSNISKISASPLFCNSQIHKIILNPQLTSDLINYPIKIYQITLFFVILSSSLLNHLPSNWEQIKLTTTAANSNPPYQKPSAYSISHYRADPRQK